MTQPIDVRVDLRAKAAYVCYAKGRVAQTIDVWRNGWVAADLDDDEHVLGIEVLGFDELTLDRARKFATERGLAFPADLAGNVASAF
jgi:uncharacterized protein YuzE